MEKHVQVPYPSERNVTLKNLKPHTTYAVDVSVIFGDGTNKTQIGPRSATKIFTTKEDG